MPGFSPYSVDIKAHASLDNLQIVLAPAPNLQRIEVKSTAQDRIPAVPASLFSISEEQIDLSGSLAVDDVLRQVPGFSTFRRSSSLYANPSSQGVSLRGVGASATSRSTVLLDGIPLNDPFGGWIYWAACLAKASPPWKFPTAELPILRRGRAWWSREYSYPPGQAKLSPTAKSATAA